MTRDSAAPPLCRRNPERGSVIRAVPAWRPSRRRHWFLPLSCTTLVNPSLLRHRYDLPRTTARTQPHDVLSRVAENAA